MKPFSQTKPLPPGVMARAKARGLRRLAGMVSDEDRDAAEAAVALSDAERAAAAAQKMADYESKRPGQRMFANARGRMANAGAALAGIKSKVMGLLGIQSTPVAVKPPVVTGSSPDEVESRVAGLFAFDPRVIGKSATIERVEQIQRFVARVEAIDSTGRVLELVSTGTPAEREASAKTIAGILDNLGTVTPAVAASTKTAATTPHKPMGQSGIEASIAREIAGQTRTAAPSSAKTVPSVASPVTTGTLSSRLTGSAMAEAQIRESLGMPPLPHHQALASKLSPIQK